MLNDGLVAFTCKSMDVVKTSASCLLRNRFAAVMKERPAKGNESLCFGRQVVFDTLRDEPASSSRWMLIAFSGGQQSII